MVLGVVESSRVCCPGMASHTKLTRPLPAHKLDQKVSEVLRELDHAPNPSRNRMGVSLRV